MTTTLTFESAEDVQVIRAADGRVEIHIDAEVTPEDFGVSEEEE